MNCVKVKFGSQEDTVQIGNYEQRSLERERRGVTEPSGSSSTEMKSVIEGSIFRNLLPAHA